MLVINVDLPSFNDVITIEVSIVLLIKGLRSYFYDMIFMRLLHYSFYRRNLIDLYNLNEQMLFIIIHAYLF